METRRLLQQVNYGYLHCYREANQVAYVLAKQSIEEKDSMFFNSRELPKQAVEPYILDRMHGTYQAQTEKKYIRMTRMWNCTWCIFGYVQGEVL